MGVEREIKILISDDDDFKANAIEKSILYIVKNAKITRTKFAKDGLREILNNDFDFVIQDMFMPIHDGEKIDSRAGIFVLKNLELRENKTKVAICSSDSISWSYMVQDCLEYIPFINFSSSIFKEELVEFLTNNNLKGF